MTGEAAAKAILLGEHAVVAGAPAVLVGLVPGMTARLGGPARTLSIEVHPWDVGCHAGHATTLGRALAALDDALAAAGVPETARRRQVTLMAAVPPRAGLGSSAALAVAVARTVAREAGLDALCMPAAAADLAAASEAVFHGSPSGADAAIAAHGGVGTFARTAGFASLVPGAEAVLVVADTGPRPPTSEMVAGVQARCERSAAARRALDRLGALSEAGATQLTRGELEDLGASMDEAHALLVELGLGTRGLDAGAAAARAAGALGAKLTGAGGGGCLVALCRPDRAAAVTAALASVADWRRAFPVGSVAP